MPTLLPLIIAYICNLIDYVFTEYWITKYGIDAEANPIGRWILTNNLGWFFKVFVVGALMALIGWLIVISPTVVWAQYVILTVYAAIVVYHLIIFAYIGGLK